MSCSWLIPTPKKAPSANKKQYTLNYKSKEWKQIDQYQSDFVFQNTSGTTLVINSFCGEFQDQELKVLALKTFNGLKDIRNRKEGPLKILDRDAYSLQADGDLDGVKVNIKVINLRRNNCYYDFLKITPKGVTEVPNQPEELISRMEFFQ